MLKKLITAMALIVVILSMAACGKSQQRFRIGVSQCSDDKWRTYFNREIEREAMFLGNVDVEIRSADDDSRRQINDIKYFTQGDFDLLIVAPNVEEDTRQAVEDAYRSGMPVVIVDRRIGGESFTAFVGADNTEVGQTCADALNAAAASKKGTVNVVELRGLRGSSPDRERHAGFVDRLKTNPRACLLASVAANWNDNTAEKVTDSLLKIYPKIDFIFAQNDRMGIGARRALEKAGRENHTSIIGVDALASDGGGVDMVIEGKMIASCFYPTGGDVVMRRAMEILEHKPFDRETKLTTYLVNPNNARIAKLQYRQLEELDSRITSLGQKLGIEMDKISRQRWIMGLSITILLLLLALFLVFLRFYWSNVEKNSRLQRSADEILHQKEELERKNNYLIEMSRELEAATHAKLAFFTNVSHDFRTPLTLIADPVDQILADNAEPLTPRQRSLLDIVRRNTASLLRLVGQVLDFQKVESGKMPMQYQLVDTAEQLRIWRDQFAPTAQQRNISLTFDAFLPPEYNGKLMATVDHDKMERMMLNLLSNALKFTPEGGKIAITLRPETNDSFCITVADNGPGISPDEVGHVFDQFYQSSTGIHAGGTGIGLAVVKAFAEMHGGSVSVESSLGEGTSFHLHLPIKPRSIDGNIVATAEESAQEPSSTPEDKNSSDKTAENIDQSASTTASDGADDERPTALIIDDNAELLDFVSDTLAPNYRILTAHDGREGLEKAIAEVPDIVVSDVMMPVMDGLECCQRLKAHTVTSHIPVLLLTACSLDEQRIAGFDCGADSYISKPFNSGVLVSRMKNLIDNRRRLLKSAANSKQADPYASLPVADREFIGRLMTEIERLMPTADLTADTLAATMNLGRVQLYRKIKAITGQSITDFVRTVRLEKARSLLLTTSLSISEVGYKVGFSSPSYFTKCYRERYNILPGDERKSNG